MKKGGSMDAQELKLNKQLRLAITLKTNQLKREQLASLTYQHVESCLIGYKWKHCKSISLNQAINDIMTLSVGEVVAFLSNQAIIIGSQLKVSDFQDLLGGE